jgi:RNA polymerase sigma-70 factor (ECF subfamily)
MSESSLSTTSLRQVVAREASAWQRVLQLYGPTVYSRCRRCGLHEDKAADVVQEVFLAAYKSVETFDQGHGTSFRAWLLGIATNKLKDQWERDRRQPRGEGGSDAQSKLAQVAQPLPEEPPTGTEDATEKTALVRRALQLLETDFEERTWKAFWRFDIDGQKATVVAAELGLTANAVHVAVCRVRKRLREEFGDFLS